MPSARRLPPIDLETYVPRSITVVRRSRGWPGFFLHERRGDSTSSGAASYPNGIRQHVLYYFDKPARQEIVYNGTVKPVHYQAGEGRFAPAGNPVVFRWNGAIRVFILAFEPWYLERIAAELGTPLQFAPEVVLRKLASDDPTTSLLRKLACEIDGGPGSTFLADSLARSIAVYLLRNLLRVPSAKPQAIAPPAAVLRAVALMRARLADSISLDELARAAGLSPFHFARQFKAATGHPPHDYHIRLRIDRAQELLRTRGREWNLAAIAHECGFADQSHFSRQFKRVVGVPPGEFLS
jgi:AraC family transcriptional regulator